jgi:nucleoid DNA-binding protein
MVKRPRRTVKKTIRRRDGVTQRYNVVPAAVKRQVVQEYLASSAVDLKRKGRVSLPQLGVLRLKVKKARPARKGRNPFTGQEMMFKAKPRTRVVKFRAAKALKEAI